MSSICVDVERNFGIWAPWYVRGAGSPGIGPTGKMILRDGTKCWNDAVNGRVHRVVMRFVPPTTIGCQSRWQHKSWLQNSGSGY